MGESREQKIEMALWALLNSTQNPCLLTVLDPIKGTPLEELQDGIDEEEILRTICIFRIILPNALLRYAGGRTARFSEEYQKLGIKAGVNALLVGNYLTTIGQHLMRTGSLLRERGKNLFVINFHKKYGNRHKNTATRRLPVQYIYY